MSGQRPPAGTASGAAPHQLPHYLSVDDQGDYQKISLISPDSIVGLTP
ncbi:hypothetical protein [Actinoplanes nipponensis]|nr:hypothetical protein [Actinoplanes nipponensis]